MSVFLLIDVTVTDEATYAQYMARVPPVVERHGGRYVVRSSQVTPETGGWAPQRIVMIEFPSLADLRACFASPEYAPLAPLRARSTRNRSVIIESSA